MGIQISQQLIRTVFCDVCEDFITDLNPLEKPLVYYALIVCDKCRDKIKKLINKV